MGRRPRKDARFKGEQTERGARNAQRVVALAESIAIQALDPKETLHLRLPGEVVLQPDAAAFLQPARSPGKEGQPQKTGPWRVFRAGKLELRAMESIKRHHFPIHLQLQISTCRLSEEFRVHTGLELDVTFLARGEISCRLTPGKEGCGNFDVDVP